jgi:hypothetical protein
MKVIGIGEQNSKTFISSCDRFIFIEVLDGAIKKKHQNKIVILKTN